MTHEVVLEINKVIHSKPQLLLRKADDRQKTW